MESFLREAFAKPNLPYAIFLLVGLTELLVVYLIYRSRRSLIQRGEETTGTVIDVVKEKGPKGNTAYYPVFQFKTFRNETITQKSKTSTSPAAYKEGTNLIIVYDPVKPEKFLIRDDKQYRLLYYIMGGLAAIFLLLGLFKLLPLLSRHV